MNLCFVSQEYPDETGWGGIGTYTYEMAHGLARRGHQVVVVSRAIAAERTYFESDGVQVHRILPRLNLNSVPLFWRLNQFWEGYQLAVALYLRQLVKRTGIDVIEAPTLHGESALLQWMENRIPIVLRIHSCTPIEIALSGEPWTRSLETSYTWERFAFRQAKHMTAPSYRIVEDNAKLVAGRKVQIIPNPVDVKRFDSDVERDESLGVLFVGRLDWRKGIRELVDAMFLVWQEFPTLPLTIVGRERSTRPGVEGPVSAWLRQRLASAPQGMVKRMDWLPRDVMPEIYAKACIGVFPSHWEPFGYVYVETMASGKPVIAAHAGGPDEIIEDNVTGRLVPPQDANALARAVLDLLSNPTKRHALGQAARQRIHTTFNTPIVVAQMAQLYQQIVEQHG